MSDMDSGMDMVNGTMVHLDPFSEEFFTEARLVALGAKGIESTRTRFSSDAVNVELVFLTDPDGTRIELVNWGGAG